MDFTDLIKRLNDILDQCLTNSTFKYKACLKLNTVSSFNTLDLALTVGFKKNNDILNIPYVQCSYVIDNDTLNSNDVLFHPIKQVNCLFADEITKEQILAQWQQELDKILITNVTTLNNWCMLWASFLLHFIVLSSNFNIFNSSSFALNLTTSDILSKTVTLDNLYTPTCIKTFSNHEDIYFFQANSLIVLLSLLNRALIPHADYLQHYQAERRKQEQAQLKIKTHVKAVLDEDYEIKENKEKEDITLISDLTNNYIPLKLQLLWQTKPALLWNFNFIDLNVYDKLLNQHKKIKTDQQIVWSKKLCKNQQNLVYDHYFYVNIWSDFLANSFKTSNIYPRWWIEDKINVDISDIISGINLSYYLDVQNNTLEAWLENKTDYKLDDPLLSELEITQKTINNESVYFFSKFNFILSKQTKITYKLPKFTPKLCELIKQPLDSDIKRDIYTFDESAYNQNVFVLNDVFHQNNTIITQWINLHHMLQYLATHNNVNLTLFKQQLKELLEHKLEHTKVDFDNFIKQSKDLNKNEMIHSKETVVDIATYNKRSNLNDGLKTESKKVEWD